MKAHTVYGIVVEAPMSDDEHDKCMHELSAADLRISEPEGQLTEIVGIPVELEDT